MAYSSPPAGRHVAYTSQRPTVILNPEQRKIVKKACKTDDFEALGNLYDELRDEHENLELTDIKLDDEKGTTPIHLAAVNYAHHPQLFRNMMDYTDFDADAQDHDGWTILHIAANDGDLNFVKLLVEETHVHIRQKNARGYTPAELAKYNSESPGTTQHLASQQREIWDYLESIDSRRSTGQDRPLYPQSPESIHTLQQVLDQASQKVNEAAQALAHFLLTHSPDPTGGTSSEETEEEGQSKEKETIKKERPKGTDEGGPSKGKGEDEKEPPKGEGKDEREPPKERVDEKEIKRKEKGESEKKNTGGKTNGTKDREPKN
eukprot:gb/GECG01002573.1/.p1 GENE.gb/GECG01002573.1/~~gb/GECG01002573.1/.p1  ORF type:complete len:319 (+),score=58.33 gb/GECG01002573.1/:1-957(+)